MAENDEERTEQATPRRRQRAREEGRIARSREFAAMATLGAVLLTFSFAGTAALRSVSGLTSRLLSLQYGSDAYTVLRAASFESLRVLAPFLLAAVITAVAANLLQGGFVFRPLALKTERLNPLTGIKNLFSLNALPGIGKSVLKFVVGALLFAAIMRTLLRSAPQASLFGIGDIEQIAYGALAKSVTAAFSVFFLIAAADYGIERWRFERSLRMTKEEVKEEFKESEGDPRTKARIRSVQRDAARRRMMAEVPKATVVITNPTHIAVAVRYRNGDTPAPTVVAKGKGFIAETIRDEARRHGIPLVEDKPLARALVKVKLGDRIPVELYRAVAKILAYVYKLRGAAA